MSKLELADFESLKTEQIEHGYSPADFIEMKAQRLIHKLDREFLSGRTKMSSWDYEEQLRNIDRWCAVNLKRLTDKNWSR
jgi:hypothetical protein